MGNRETKPPPILERSISMISCDKSDGTERTAGEATVAKEGILLKQPTGLTKDIVESKWRERYFCLRRGALTYSIIYDEIKVDMDATAALLNSPFSAAPRVTEYGFTRDIVCLDDSTNGSSSSNGTLRTLASYSIEWGKNWENLGGKVWVLQYPGSYWETWRQYYVSSTTGNSVVLQWRQTQGIFPLSNSLVEISSVVPNVLHICTTNTNNTVINTSNTTTLDNASSEIKGDALPSRILTIKCPTDADFIEWMQVLGQNCLHPTHPRALESITTLEFYNVLHDTLAKKRGTSAPFEPLKRNISAPLPSWPLESCTPEAHLPHPQVIDETPFVTQSSCIDDDDSPRPYFILSIDGGGVRGIVSCIILERIVARFPDFMDRVSLVAGTSNGALISVGLAFGIPIETIRKLTEITCTAIFSEIQTRYNISQAKWSNRYLEMCCEEIWGTRKLQDATIPCLVPALQLDDKAEVHRSMQITTFSSFENGDHLAKDVVMRSCAAPTYFPSWQGYIDGGVFAHSPSDYALSYAFKLVNKESQDRGTECKRADSLNNRGFKGAPVPLLLSLSTGHVPHYIEDDGSAHNFGLYQWLPKMSVVMWDSMIQKSSLLCQNFLGERYHRVDPVLEREVALDEAQSIPHLSSVIQGMDLSETIAWIERNLYNNINNDILGDDDKTRCDKK